MGPSPLGGRDRSPASQLVSFHELLCVLVKSVCVHGNPRLPAFPQAPQAVSHHRPFCLYSQMRWPCSWEICPNYSALFSSWGHCTYLRGHCHCAVPLDPQTAGGTRALLLLLMESHLEQGLTRSERPSPRLAEDTVCLLLQGSVCRFLCPLSCPFTLLSLLEQ